MKLSTSIIATTGIMTIASSLWAQTVTVSQIPGYHADAGEFNVTPIVGTGYDSSVIVSNGFETFCISRSAGIGLPGAYYSSVSASGIYMPDNLTIPAGVAWLYSEFATGKLSGYHYAGAGIVDPGHTLSERAEDAYSLQLALWTLEGSYWYGAGGPGPASAAEDIAFNPWLNLVANQFGGGTNGLIAAMSANSPGGYNVGVLNLNQINLDGSIGTAVQPVLVLLGTPPPPPSNLGSGDTATIGFWQNKNGQALIKSLPNSPALGNWLGNNFPCLYGNLAGKSDAYIASYFVQLFSVKGQKTYAQVLAGAFACYVTDSNLAGNTAAKYGFSVSSGGTGGKNYNVGSLGTVLGLQNNTSYTVLQLLQAANQNCPFSPAVFNALNTIFSDINQTGDIQ